MFYKYISKFNACNKSATYEKMFFSVSFAFPSISNAIFLNLESNNVALEYIDIGICFSIPSNHFVIFLKKFFF